MTASSDIFLPAPAGLIPAPGDQHADIPTVYQPHDQPGFTGRATRRVARSSPAGWLRTRAPVILTVIVQIVLSIRLSNSAFQDEALYIYAGHREIALLL